MRGKEIPQKPEFDVSGYVWINGIKDPDKPEEPLETVTSTAIPTQTALHLPPSNPFRPYSQEAQALEQEQQRQSVVAAPVAADLTVEPTTATAMPSATPVVNLSTTAAL